MGIIEIDSPFSVNVFTLLRIKVTVLYTYVDVLFLLTSAYFHSHLSTKLTQIFKFSIDIYFSCKFSQSE